VAAILVNTNRRTCAARLVEVDGLGDSLSARAVVDHRRVDPPLLSSRNTVTVNIFAVFDAVEIHGSEVPWAGQDGAVGVLCGGLGDKPVAGMLLEVALEVGLAAPLVGFGDLHDFAEVVQQEEVLGWKDLHLDDRENAVEDVVVVDFAGDALFTDVVNGLGDIVMVYGWKVG
jgi:hypothetical protein